MFITCCPIPGIKISLSELSFAYIFIDYLFILVLFVKKRCMSWVLLIRKSYLNLIWRWELFWMQFWWDEERECNSCKYKCLKEFPLCLKGKYAEKDTYYVFNHLEIKMFYHQPSDAEWDATLGSVGGRIVSAKVIPRRYSHSVPSQDHVHVL